MNNIKIIIAEEHHFDEIWEIFHQVVKLGDSYVYSPDTTKLQAKAIWMEQPLTQTFIALIDNKICGTYILKPNFPGLGSHVANCSYMVNPNFRRVGVGKVMGKHSIEIAKGQGFLAMQFNIVVSTNIAAVKLWESLGFKIIGTSSKAFIHKELGLVDTYIMHRII
jgi:GNAT superfamily N-acetyltransferase